MLREFSEALEKFMPVEGGAKTDTESSLPSMPSQDNGHGRGIERETRSLSEYRPESNPRYSWNDIGNGNLFADVYRDRARLVSERKTWFVYDGRVWREDSGALWVMELCKTLVDDLIAYALTIEDERVMQDYVNFLRKLQKRSSRETIIKDAASVYPVEYRVFDADPYLLNCQNGTLNLRTGAFAPHQAQDMLSKLAGVSYDETARCERWERFIDEIMQGDEERALFLQKAMGYALTGDTRRECCFILYGPTCRNGKGTTMETFMRLMGDYGKAANPDTIAQKQCTGGSGPSEDIARLAGARFVNISEPDKRMMLSAALVKTLTGNDTITARKLHENSIEFRPQFKFFINTNYLPSVTDDTVFQSGRVKVIPFERQFSESERDDRLKGILAQPEAVSGILNWCMDGLRALEETGLDMPRSVQAATDEYRAVSDKVGRFMDDELQEDKSAEATVSDVYVRYGLWCEANGHNAENKSNFMKSLRIKVEVRKKRPNGSSRMHNATNMIVGYRLKDRVFPVNEENPFGLTGS